MPCILLTHIDTLGGVAKLILNDNYESISTIPKGEANTHERVPQFLIVVPTMIDLAPALVAAVQAEVAKSKEFKAIVFAPTAAHVDFYGHILSTTHGLPSVSLLHARIAQSKRTKVTEEFRRATSGICIATDVIARGMDFPNVSHVFQCGLPMDRESYIHRLGRTARADASGSGILILAEPERRFVNLLKGIKLSEYPIPLNVSAADIQQQLTSYESPKKIYQAFLGYYKTFQKITAWNVEELVQQANRFVLEGLGAPEVPGLEKNIVGKMGLKAVRGLVIIPNAPGSGQQRRGGGGGGREGGGGGGGGRGMRGGGGGGRR
jgi:ATP-dependent RNA helicase MSS116